MIPKKIHYCWFGGNEIPSMLQKSMATWNEFMPDYELVLWNEDNFDTNSVKWVKEAISVKKWAFVADYVRLYAIFTEGGIYLDTDVIVKNSFDRFLEHNFFTAVEDNKSQKGRRFLVQTAIFGAVAKHPYLKDCMNWYENKHFILQDGSFSDSFIAPDIYAQVAEKYGFIHKDDLQTLDNGMVIYPSDFFTNEKSRYSKDTYAIHWCSGSWRDRKNILKKILSPIYRKMLCLKGLKYK